MFTILTIIILIIILFILFYFILKKCLIPKNIPYECHHLIPDIEVTKLEDIMTHQMKKLNENEHNIINNKLEIEGKKVSQSIDNGDCFFESIAICLNNIGIKDKNDNKYTAKLIRMIERDYIDHSYNDKDFQEYIDNYYISGKNDFLTYIGFNVEDINSCNEIITCPLSGEPKRDLYILCKQLNIDVRIICSENNILSDFIYFFQNNNFCEKEFIKEQYDDKIILEIASDGKHFVPIIKI